MKKNRSQFLKYNIETPNIFKKLFLGFIIIPIIPVLALVYFTLDAQEEREQAVADNISNSAVLIAEKIDSWINSNINISNLTSQFDDIQSMTSEQQKPLLKLIKDSSQAITAVRVDGADGIAITRSDDKALKDYSDRQYFKTVQEGGNLGQQVIFGKNQQRPVFCFTVPINNGSSFLGTLNQCSVLDEISTDVTDLKIGKTGFAILVDNSNQLIAHGGRPDGIGQLEDMSGHPAIAHNSFDEVFTFVEDGKNMISYKIKTGLDWTLVIQQEYDEAFASLIAAERNSILTVIVTILVCIAILYLLSLMISKPLQQARQQTDNILGAANDGLFLIDKNFIIGTQQSANLPDILQKDDLAGTDFVKYLMDYVPLDVAHMAKDYIGLLFSERVKEELVQTRNPLKLVKTSIEGNKGEIENKYLSLTFKRVYRDSTIENLLVTAKDITNEIIMQKALDKAREEKNEQINLLSDILHIPPTVVQKFIGSTEKELKEINKTLRKSDDEHLDFTGKIKAIYRIIHKVKGDASAIRFNLFASECHKFEETLEGIRSSTGPLTGNKFLPLTIALDELFSKCSLVSELLEKLGSFNFGSDSDYTAKDSSQGHTQPWQQLSNLAEDIATRHKKEVEVHFKGFKANVAQQYQDSLRDIATQLIRNSLIHGIELPAARKRLSKIQQGQITMSIKSNDDREYIFTYMDDGQGIDYKKIRSKLVEKRIISEDRARYISDEEVLKLSLRSQLSTQDQVDIDAGRGVGLSIIVSKVRAMGGKVKISSVQGKHTLFKIIIPAEERMAA